MWDQMAEAIRAEEVIIKKKGGFMARKQKDQFEKTYTKSNKVKAGNAARQVSNNEPGNISPSRGEVRGEPGVRRGGSNTAATGFGLRPKSGVTGSDLDGQVTDQ
jgi:hypothetical protein